MTELSIIYGKMERWDPPPVSPPQAGLEMETRPVVRTPAVHRKKKVG